MSLLDNLKVEEIEIKKDVKSSKNIDLNFNKSLIEMIEKKDKITKYPVATYLTEDVLDKLKTVSMITETSIANIIEQAMINLTESIEIDDTKVKKYNKKNKGRLRK